MSLKEPVPKFDEKQGFILYFGVEVELIEEFVDDFQEIFIIVFCMKI